MYKVKLTKIESKHKNLRTDEVVGVTELGSPIQGEPFIMKAEALDSRIKDIPGAARLIYTTPVLKWRHPDESGQKQYNKYEVATKNSIYLIEYLEEVTNEST